MGLDMMARVRAKAPDRPVDFVEDGDNDDELHYWRKHPNLHGWMEKLYREKGGTDADFNVAPVVLTAEDLDRLERDVRNGDLPHTTGFFFGQSDPDDAEGDLEFIAKARDAIREGKTVYYTSWW